MAGSNDIFNTVRNAVDIVDVISEHLTLRRAGKEFKALCPFHDDHKPSMAVVPQKQIFHCFVCGTGGDVFAFVKNYHKMTNGEALKYLAQKGGIKLPELPQGRGRSSGDSSVREQIVAANEKACGFFEKYLRLPEGKAGLDYLKSRGLTDETIKRFRLGYSPENWTGLVTAAGRIGITNDQLVQAGLAKKRQDGGLYDAFRGRVIFPILDATDRVIAFGGRILVEKRDEAGNIVEAKYLNSPETPVFNKSASLYGLPLAKSAIIKSETCVVVEGYMDVIACHQAGVSNVVATLGTAMTPEHARILRRFCQTVTLVFDSDDAGYRAADRALETFVREPLDVKIASVPDGKDPCDFCMNHGGKAFEEVVKAATEAMTFQWERLKRQFGATDSLSGKQEAATQYMRFVAQAMEGRAIDPIRRGLLMSRLSELVGLPTDEVAASLKRLAQGGAGNGVQSNGGGSTSPAEAMQNGPVLVNGRETLRGKAKAEAWVLGALLTQPMLYEGVKDDLNTEMFATFTLLAERVMEYLENAGELEGCTLADFVASVNDDKLAGQGIGVQMMAEAGGRIEQLLADGCKALADSQLSIVAADPTDEAQRLLELGRLCRSRGEVRQVLPPKQAR